MEGKRRKREGWEGVKYITDNERETVLPPRPTHHTPHHTTLTLECALTVVACS